jgi:cell division protein FtsI (penicillin-binding protein 3)
MIDEPSNGKYYGGEVAAPVFAQVMAGSLRTLGIQPDAPLKPLLMTAAEPAREEM